MMIPLYYYLNYYPILSPSKHLYVHFPTFLLFYFFFVLFGSIGIITYIPAGMLLYQLLSEHESSESNHQGGKKTCLQGLCRYEEEESVCAVLMG